MKFNGRIVVQMLVVLSVPLIQLLVSVPSALAEEPTPVKLPIGMNLTSVRDYQPGYPFKNLWRSARPWMTKNLDRSGPHDTGLADKLEVDADGYPLELPAVVSGSAQAQIVFTIISNQTEAGRYVVLYDGEGAVTGAMTTQVVESTPGRCVIQLKGKDDHYEGIAITRSSRGNHVRNIRIVAEADEHIDLAADPFREDFLAYCRQWHALRFMDWMETNNSTVKEWSPTKLPGFAPLAGAGGRGMDVRLMIRLANITQTDPWFCMPHRATDEYLTEFAKLVKAELDPKRKVYLEYSNEVWNWQFQQAHWMLQGKLAGDLLTAAGGQAWKDDVVPTDFPLDDGERAKSGGINHPERMAALDRRCFEKWEQVFTGEDRARLVRVIAVQHSWPDTARRTAAWVVQHGGADALACGAYVAPNNDIYKRWDAAGASLTAKQVIDDMNDAFEKDSAPWTRKIAEIAKANGLKYLVYEGGQHIQPQGQKELPYMPALKSAQYHVGLYDLYMKNFRLQKEVGCDLFMAFSSISKQGTRYGSWGHLERYDQPADRMPKFKALVDADAPRDPRK